MKRLLCTKRGLFTKGTLSTRATLEGAGDEQMSQNLVIVEVAAIAIICEDDFFCYLVSQRIRQNKISRVRLNIFGFFLGFF